MGERSALFRRECLSLVRHFHHLIDADRITLAGVDPRFFFRLEEIGMFIPLPFHMMSPGVREVGPYKRGEFLGSPPDLFFKCLVQRTDSLVDPVIVRGPFHVARELADKVGDHQ